MSNSGKTRILVVDDEPGMREGCRKILAAEGFEVITACDGEEGLGLCRSEGSFAVALVDLKMPRMGGMEFVEHVRGHDECIVVLVITAHATIDTAVEATKKGAYGYLPKPFTPDELLLQVRNGLERRHLAMAARRLQKERDERLLELRYERSKANAIIQCMADGVVVVNQERRVVLANAAVRRILWHSDVEELFPLERLGCAGLETAVCQALDSAPDRAIVTQEATLGGATYMISAGPLVRDDGGTNGAIAVLRDITEIKELEATKAAFVSMVSHEVTSHLGAIEGYLNMLLYQGVKDQRTKQVMERTVLRASTLRTLLIELMDLSALETGTFAVTRVPVELEAVVHDAVEVCAEAARAKNIGLTVDHSTAAGGCSVLADRGALLTVLRNLVENAIKYTPADGHVRVSTACQPLFATVRVVDDGIGMSDEERARVFEEFYRVRNPHTAQIPGTGLGLSLVKRLVEIHDGTIEVRSSPGNGSEFVVRLPRPTDC
jgi:signal transduction histidine kinase